MIIDGFIPFLSSTSSNADSVRIDRLEFLSLLKNDFIFLFNKTISYKLFIAGEKMIITEYFIYYLS